MGARVGRDRQARKSSRGELAAVPIRNTGNNPSDGRRSQAPRGALEIHSKTPEERRGGREGGEPPLRAKGLKTEDMRLVLGLRRRTEGPGLRVLCLTQQVAQLGRVSMGPRRGAVRSQDGGNLTSTAKEELKGAGVARPLAGTVKVDSTIDATI